MLAILSPAKKLAVESTLPAGIKPSTPEFLEQAATLAGIMRVMSPAQVSDLMSLSDKLAQLNVARYQQWQAKVDGNTQPAAMLFQGDVYQGLDTSSLSVTALQYFNDHVRILSGLYGILRPLDAIYPYRLEMGVKLNNPLGSNLYHYWSATVTNTVNTLLAQQAQPELVQLASKEYASVIDLKAVSGRIVQPVFKDYKNGSYKIISFFAKKARGYMARFIAENAIEQAEDIKHFAKHGYSYNKSMSDTDTWVFSRQQPQ